MKKKLRLFLMLMLAVFQQAYAQTRTVTGTVTDRSSGQGLPGVAVSVKGTTSGTSTSPDGTYSIAVPAGGATLVYRFLGYETVERAVGDQQTINVALGVDAKQLNEVVVTAFGIEREEKSLSYSVQQIGAEEVTRANQPNVTNALQGKVAGVIVRQSSGLPGSSSTITIRGNRSFQGNNQPLYVIDGMPIESNASFAGGVSGTDASSRALDINPNDIESISVLKGGAAAALYGVRASNGVVVITTKKGKGLADRKGASVTFNSDYSIDRVSVLPDIQDQYAQGSGGVFNGTTSLSWGPRISTLGDITDPAGNTVPGNRVFDNVTPFFQTGHTFTNGITVANKGELGNYAVTLGYTDQEGIIPTTGMERFNAKVGGDFKLNPKLTLGVSVNYADTHVDKVPGGSNLSNPLFTLYAAPRTFDLWGIPFADPNNPYRQINYRAAIDNPRWALANNLFYEDTRRFIGSGNITYKPLEWLSFNYRLGNDFFITDGKEVYELGSGQTGGRTATPSGGQINDYTFVQNQVNSNISAIINRDVTEDLNVNLLLGSELYEINSRLLNNLGQGIGIGGLRNIGNTTVQTTSETMSSRRTVGFYSNLELGYKNYLFLNASARQDYVSNLAPGNRTFFYPSVGVGFAFTDAFELESNILDFGKIRASYAEVGQAPEAAFITKNTFIAGGAGSGFLTDNIQFPFNGLNGRSLSNVLNSPTLRPQNTKTIEVGADLRFLKNRITLDYTYYVQTTTDQIFGVPLAPSAGFTSEFRNAGKLETKGHELIATITPVRSEAFEWTLTTNFSSYENTVLELAEGVENIFLGGFVTPNIRAEAGAAYPIIFGSSFVRDPEGRVVVDSREKLANGSTNPFYGMPLVGPETNIGNVQPDFEFTFTNGFTFKGINLTAQVDWRKGGNMYAGNTRLLKLYGQDAVTQDRETPYVYPGAKGFIDADGKLVLEGNNDISILRGQNYWATRLDAITESNVYSTSFVRLREIALSYSLPTALLSKTPFRSASFVVTGRNLFLVTDYPNFDPETSVGGSGNFQGLEYVSLPQARSYGVGLKVGF